MKKISYPPKRRSLVLWACSIVVVSIVLTAVSTCYEPVVVETPEGFADIEGEDLYAAISPEGMIYRVRVFKNAPQQGLEFWSEALGTHLEKAGYAGASTENTFSAHEVSGLFSEWTIPYREEMYKYLTGILINDDAIAVAEAAGEHMVYAAHREAVLESLETINFGEVQPAAVAEYQITTLTQEKHVEAEPSRGGCFLAGTTVITDSGGVPIETIWPGTGVWVYDPVVSRWKQQMVTRSLSIRYFGDIVTLGIEGETIKVTGNHPVLVSSGFKLSRRPLPEELTADESLEPTAGRWVEARNLRWKDVLVSMDGVTHRIDSISKEIKAAQVYHLSLTAPHTYTVGQSGIVVHNGGSAESVKQELMETAAREQEIIGSGVISASMPQDAQDQRIRVYSGACVMVVDSVEQTKREISSLTEAFGGYVELSSEKGIVIRIPARDFRNAFNSILNLGEVLHKAIETYDVTSQFMDTERRLVVAIRARDRLYTVLNKVEDPKERLEILKKIREYSETIEKLELSQKVLEKRIALSRITVDLRPRLADENKSEKPIPFRWISRLHPLYSSTYSLNNAVAVSFSDDIAVFEQEETVRAEAADGTRIRIGTVKNDPRGDSRFWQKALIYHLGSRYKSTEPVELNTLKFALFESKDRDPYYFMVGSIPTKDAGRLIVFEVYFPDSSSKEKHLEELLDSFDNAEVKS